MGIRIKLLAGLFLLVLLPLVASQAWLYRSLTQGYLKAEVDMAHQGMGRLLKAIDAQLKTHEVLLNEWANWSELAQYVTQPTSAFAEDNLTQDSIQSSHIEWMAILNLRGEQIYSVSSEANQAETVLSGVHGPVLKRAAQHDERVCGLTWQPPQWWVLCRQAIKPSSGVGDGVGLIVTGQKLHPEFARQLHALTGLEFELSHTATPSPPDSYSGPPLTTPLGMATPQMQILPQAVMVWWPLQDLSGHPAGHVALTWPRNLSEQARSDLTDVLLQMLIFIALLGLALMVMLDKVVITRIQRFTHELRAIRARSAWSERVSADGKDEIHTLQQESNQLLQLIEQQLGELQQLADTDSLTGLANRRKFQQSLDRALAIAKRHQRPVSLLVLDVDHFKLYNDHYGHPQGDVALKALAGMIQSLSKRPGDLPARLGGEEFAVLLEDTDLSQALAWAAQLQDRLKTLALVHARSPVADRMTMSMGVATWAPDEHSSDLYRRADHALYAAKAAGRNQIQAATQPAR